ncbi:hypothetical protein HGH93_12925 [Chitinophaga polysaccharea]|uniref:toxin-antitoxin system YwqK family antitoxin n=1 Tax=Chitinophaga polysaccharea TaxID=1293035 RepID=UPI00145549E9|nr:hypothetical protein [Chitinophaga polysaccharea]NLR59011.1 hypothetical protein [Chitinophaga polysaccharea]
MRNSILCTIILLIVIAGCQQNREIQKTFFPDGRLESKIVELSKDKAKYISYYNTGAIASEGELDRHLAKEGAWRFLYPNGEVLSYGEYSDDLKDGMWNYKLKDTSFSIQWEKYINRPLKLNLPKGWIIEGHLAPYSLLTAYSDNDSINYTLGFNISLIENDRGEAFDTLVLKATQFFDKQLPPVRGSVSDAIADNIKSKKVIQYVMGGGKEIKTYRLYIPDGKVVYLLSFILQQPEKEFFYNKIMEDVASSFHII